MKEVAIGIDLGGTLVRVGAFDRQGELLVMHEAPIEAARGAEHGLQKIQTLIEQVISESKAMTLIGVGIGSTGPVDRVKGTINNPYTLPTWEDVHVVDWLQSKFNVPTILENDADAAALGEYWHGAGRSAKRMYAVTVGTGIGTSLIIDGEIYRGLDGSHPEGGHMVLDPSGPLCYCKQRGCWEILCAGPAIAAQAREADLSRSNLLAMANGNRSAIDARMVFEAARAGDKVALAIVDQFSRYFAQAILNIAMLFVPDMIVLSGGVMRSLDLVLPRLEKTLQDYPQLVPSQHIKILPAQLEDSGLYGAAQMVLQKQE